MVLRSSSASGGLTESDLGIVGAAATKRQATSTAWQQFSDSLRQQLSGSLNPELQKGMAADNIREAFQWGADQAGDVAKTNGVISDATSFRTRERERLEFSAGDDRRRGKIRNQRIQQSKDSPPIKMGEIVEVVMQCQQDANAAAAPMHTKRIRGNAERSSTDEEFRHQRPPIRPTTRNRHDPHARLPQ